MTSFSFFILKQTHFIRNFSIASRRQAIERLKNLDALAVKSPSQLNQQLEDKNEAHRNRQAYKKIKRKKQPRQVQEKPDNRSSYQKLIERVRKEEKIGMIGWPDDEDDDDIEDEEDKNIREDDQDHQDSEITDYAYASNRSAARLKSSSKSDRRSLSIVILGTPNAGKSVLVNRLVKEKVTAVSPKRNTTRGAILGVHTYKDTQLVIYDTPGINPLDVARGELLDLSTTAWTTASSADLGLVIIDAAKKITEAEMFLLKKAKEMQDRHKLKLSLVLNKVDLVHPKEKLLTLVEKLWKSCDFEHCWMISALTGDGVRDVENYLNESAVRRPWDFEPDQKTDMTIKERVEEIIREKIYLRLHKEIPYRVRQENMAWVDMHDGSLKVDQLLIVETKGQKGVLIGHQGATLKHIGEEAKKELEEILNREVHLFFRVTVREPK